jgi:predicted enzyme related to lactoylglutathione lyase
MTTITRHAQGTFVWPELGTTDPAAAKKFYGALFGWTIEDHDMGAQGTYTILKNSGRDAGALYPLNPEMHKGIPPHWGSYIAVDNVDESAKKAESLGAKILMAPFDVMDKGRMAIVQDPLGATFSLWQANSSIGATVLGEPGSLAWTQLNATDPARAKPFYTALLGWTYRDDPMGEGGVYTSFQKPNGDMAGGMMAMPKEDTSTQSHWLVYFAVNNVDETFAKATSLGAKPYVPPSDIPGVGRFAVIGDPQGAVFSIVKFLPPLAKA